MPPRQLSKFGAIIKMEIDHSRWNVFYPLYIDSNFSREQGRKTLLTHSTKSPNLQDVFKIFRDLGIECLAQPNKRHPADFFSQGRIKYRLKNEEGQFYNQEIKTRRMLIKKIGQLVPKTQAQAQVGQLKKKKRKQ